MRFSKFHAQIEKYCWLSLTIVRQKYHLKKLGKLKSEPAQPVLHKERKKKLTNSKRPHVCMLSIYL
jgi:hypothetical protein